jgi:calcineurin-like phosphoesterase
VRFAHAEGESKLNAVLVTVDDKTGKAISIERIQA